MKILELVVEPRGAIRWEPLSGVLQKRVDDPSPTAFRPSIAKLLELIRFLERDGASEEIHAFSGMQGRPPSIVVVGGGRASIAIRCDYYEIAPATNRASGLHYRMEIRRDGSKSTRDVWTDNMGTVAKTIRLTFGLKESSA